MFPRAGSRPLLQVTSVGGKSSSATNQGGKDATFWDAWTLSELPWRAQAPFSNPREYEFPAQRKASPWPQQTASSGRQSRGSTGIPTDITGQEGRRNPRNKEPCCTEVSSQGNRKKTNPKQISIALQCKCIQTPQGTSGSIQPPNEAFLPALLLPLLLPAATDHPQPATVSLGAGVLIPVVGTARGTAGTEGQTPSPPSPQHHHPALSPVELGEHGMELCPNSGGQNPARGTVPS